MKASRNPTPSVIEISSPIQIQSLPIRNVNSDNSNMPASREYTVYLVLKGMGDLWVDVQKFSLDREQVILLRPGQFHRFEHPESLQGFSIHFKDLFQNNHDGLLPIDHLSLFGQYTSIEIKEMVTDLLGIAKKMMLERTNTDGLNSKILFRYFDIFLTYVTRQVSAQMQFEPKTRNFELVAEFMTLLEENFTEEKMVYHYAAQLRVTPNYLNQVVKKTTGCSAGQQIRNRLILEAKRHALHSGMNMKEIAYSLGFREVSHFSKLFKNVTGNNFTEFKRQQVTAAFPLRQNLLSLANLQRPGDQNN